ncbi:MAG TPA: S8 family serine peptidase, partial [Balneolaceae bacterium]|nr:S8 family serine peptidase [Balneolaceae bacterium]
VVNAYKNGTVMVGMALPYDGIGIGFPANLASDHVVFTVGAANLNNGPFQYSGIPESDGISFDTKDINLIAPGVDLLTTVTGNQKYDKVSGTAASAALTTGIISLLQAAESDLTPDDIAHILEKTAAPVGSPGYNDKSGYGLIDAGAAMNYVQSHDIKHGTTTDAEIQKVANNRKITLFSASAWEEVASSVYFADIYKVTYTIPLVPSPNNDLWFNAKGTYGWSYANPNSQNKWVNVELLNDHATITTYIYNLYNYIGQHVGWHPASPNTVQLHYSYVGQIQTPPPPSLEVTISGPNRVNSGQSATFSANVLRADGPVSYQWYYRRTGDSGPLWHIPLNNSSSSFSHTFYGPDEKISIAGVKIKVTSGGETATDILNFPVYGQGCSDGPAGDEGIGISGTIPAPCD